MAAKAVKNWGTHTWPLTIHYHRCPQCGAIIESRERFQHVMGRDQKELYCPRCQLSFTLTKERPKRFGPLLGDPQPPEFDWQS